MKAHREDKYLICRGRDGSYCTFADGSNSLAATHRVHGFSVLQVTYRMDPWAYSIQLVDGGNVVRTVSSSVAKSGDVGFADSRDPFDFEDRSVFERLKDGIPIGRGEIVKFCRHFGWPHPLSHEFLQFVVDCEMYEFPVTPGAELRDAKVQRRLLREPPGWRGKSGEEAELGSMPHGTPAYAVERSERRRQWTEFCDALEGEIRSSGVDPSVILLIPEEEILRLNEGGEYLKFDGPDESGELREYEHVYLSVSTGTPSYPDIDAEVLGCDAKKVVYVVIRFHDMQEGRKIRFHSKWSKPVEVFLGCELDEGIRRPFDAREFYGLK